LAKKPSDACTSCSARPSCRQEGKAADGMSSNFETANRYFAMPTHAIQHFPRSELELMLAQIIEEVLDNDIVPKKLAKAFPGSRFESES
jgi:hypothetical protein